MIRSHSYGQRALAKSVFPFQSAPDENTCWNGMRQCTALNAPALAEGQHQGFSPTRTCQANDTRLGCDRLVHPDHLCRDTFYNSAFLKSHIESCKAYYGCYTEAVLDEKIYATRCERLDLKFDGIRYAG